MRIPDNILNILSNCRTDGNVAYLPEGQLERKTYEAVNKCLESIGGKWNRKAKGHVFDEDPAELLDALVVSGEVVDAKKVFQFFPTPRPIAERMCDMARLEAARAVLEPSCGECDLADVIYERIKNVTCLEINFEMAKRHAGKPYPVYCDDFLRLDPEISMHYPRIVMNPPFSRQQDIDHIYHAFRLLEPGGILVSIVSESPFFRTNKKSVVFRTWLEVVGAEIHELPAGAFSESGTMVKTRIIKVRKRGKRDE